jgi:SAM-dependent methyltransferase
VKKQDDVKNNPVQKLADTQASQETDQKKIVQEAYGNVAKEGGFVSEGCGCCGGGCELSELVGYTKEELEMFADANLGLGCGHPVSLGFIKEGDVVLDLGSGAGLDCFLAARKVGTSGKVVGVDMTPAMIEKARANAKKYGFTNVEFRLGDIEALPVESNSIDVIMSNCVINLAPNKDLVFKGAARALKPGGFMAISDVVLLKELSEAQKNDAGLLCACVGGAILKDTYINMLEQAGFEVTVISEDREIGKKWFNSDELHISSLKFIAHKK